MNFKALFRRPEVTVGVDIGLDAVAMVVLSPSGRRGSGVSVERYALEPMPDNVLNLDGGVDVPDVLVEVIERCLKTLGGQGGQAALALPSSSVGIKEVRLNSAMGDDEIDEWLQGNLKGMFPFDVAEAPIDFRVLGPADSQNSRVIVAAAAGTAFDDRVAAAQKAGLDVAVVDADSMVLHAAMQDAAGAADVETAGKICAVVNISKSLMSLLVYKDSEVIYTWDRSFGWDQIASQAHLHLAVPLSLARTCWMDGSQDAVDGMDDMLEQYVEQLVFQVQHAANLFTTSTSHQSFDLVLLNGAGACVAGAAAAVEAGLGVKCILMDAARQAGHGKSVDPDELRRDAPRLTIALELARRRFEE